MSTSVDLTTMQRGDLAVSARGISKSYTIQHEATQVDTLVVAALQRARRPFAKRKKETFWALQNISFDIQRGEVVGFIGRNGAGKSTLLKVLSRITTPTTGEIGLRGRVGSLLEVGTGFHPELTGRENIFLNGAILGMKRSEINAQFDAIVDFSGVEQFLDTPVKRYSSGMFVRLAFSVAAHLNPEILIVDEVLAVGDADFQRRCMGKMEDVANQGRTILFVSHNMTSVRALCRRCVLLRNGQIEFDGPADQATEYHLAETAAPSRAMSESGAQTGVFDVRHHENRYGEQVWIQKITLLNEDGEPSSSFAMDESLTIQLELENLELRPDLVVVILFNSAEGQRLGHVSTSMKPSLRSHTTARTEQFTIKIPRMPFTPGTYHLEILLRTPVVPFPLKLDRVVEIVRFEITPADVLKSGFEYSKSDGLVYLDSQWERSALD